MIEYPADRSGKALYWCPVHDAFLGDVTEKKDAPTLHPHPSKERDRKEKKDKKDKDKEKDK